MVKKKAMVWLMMAMMLAAVLVTLNPYILINPKTPNPKP